MNYAVDRELQAKEYLEKHRIMELLSQLTSFLLFDRPKKPREYLITLLERLKIAKVVGVAFPFFMENSNIVSMFEMMDSSGKGCISFVQYKEALKSLGLCTADEVLHDDGHIITLDKFRDEVISLCNSPGCLGTRSVSHVGSDSLRSTCLCLPRAEITGLGHRRQSSSP
ncbi:EF-hand calcium-binding domain-containing protein 10 isoform X1 [Alexandromys fortis]|uniref:EF-hand calcium-binding domain-containing protein 10 isoform X1 n=1 Tax=Alexandromys fortis TaxID=100897 RepID=UPI0021520F4D|nr:EF-hand calcium-binding domain-containing protein 10 isoform X1 [Microtus fortis]